jgi:hypothetical protein
MVEDLQIPSLIFENFIPNERIFFKTEGHYKRKSQIIIRTIIVLSIIIFSILALITPLNNFNTFFISEGAFVAWIFLIIGIIALIYSYFNYDYNEKYFLLITDEKIHYLEKVGKSKIDKYGSILLSNLKAVTYSPNNKAPLKTQNTGTINFISNKVMIYEPFDSISIRNVKNLYKKLEIIESIVWYFGNFEKRLEILENNENFTVPYNLQISKSKISIYQKGINYQDENNYVALSFSEKLFFDYKKRWDFSNEKPKPIATIFIKSLSESNQIMTIGPVENYLNLLEKFFILYCKWKISEKKLLSKNEVLRLEERHPNYIKSKETISFENGYQPSKLPNQITKSLEKDERVLLCYKPNPNMKKNKIMIYLSLFSLIFLVFQFIYMGITETVFISLLFSIFSISISLMLIVTCMFPLMSNAHNKMVKDMVYVFTTKRLILQFRDKLIVTSYDNIISVNQNENKKSFMITLFLNEPLEMDFFLSKDVITIQIVPKDMDLLKRIKELRNNYILNKE